MCSTVKNIKLSNGQEIPPIGLGTFEIPNEELEATTKEAIDIGYRLIDTAYVYQNEKELGAGIAEKIKQGVIKREDIFYITKLWNTKHRPKSVVPSLKRTLADAKLDYTDLYMIHFPLACKKVINNKFEMFILPIEEFDVTIEETWLAAEQCVKLGLAKSLGLSNFNKSQIERILKVATIKPVAIQVEVNPYLNQKKLIEFAKEKNLAVIGYSPFYAPGRKMCFDHGLKLFEEPILKELADKYKKTVPQIILRYLTQLGVIPIPKPANSSQLKENFDIFDITLSAADVEKVNSLNKNLRCTPYPNFENFREYPFHAEY